MIQLSSSQSRCLSWSLLIWLACSCSPSNESPSGVSPKVPLAKDEAIANETPQNSNQAKDEIRQYALELNQTRTSQIHSPNSTNPVEQKAISTLAYDLTMVGDKQAQIHLLTLQLDSGSPDRLMRYDSSTGVLQGMPDFVPKVFNTFKTIDFEFLRQPDGSWQPVSTTLSQYDTAFNSVPSQARDYFKSTLASVLSMEAIKTLLSPHHVPRPGSDPPKSWSAPFFLPDRSASSVPIEVDYAFSEEGQYTFNASRPSEQISPTRSLESISISGTMTVEPSHGDTVSWEDTASWKMIIQSGFNALRSESEEKSPPTTLHIQIQRSCTPR